MDESDIYKPEVRRTITKGFGASTGPLHSNSFSAVDCTKILASVETDLNQYSVYINEIGSRLDSVQRREELRALIKNKLQTISQQIKESGKNDIAANRLSNQLSNLLERFKELVNLEKERKTNNDQAELVNSYSTSYSGNNNHVVEVQDQLVDRSQDILQRADEIRYLERDISDLNDIAIELKDMVQEQGQNVERIEKFTERAANNVRVGAENTQKSAVLKNKNRKLLLVIFLIVGIVAAVIVLVIVLAVSITQAQN